MVDTTRESLDDFLESENSSLEEKTLTYRGSKELNTENYVSDIDEADRLGFAKMVLLFLFILVVLVFVASYIAIYNAPENEKLSNLVDTILDVTKTAVPSIVTLVLGFYFGRKE